MADRLLLLLLQLLTFLPFVLAVKTVYFSKPYCDEYRIYIEPGDVYEVVWNGEKYSKFCNLRFRMKGIDTYKLCAEVTKFQYECEGPGEPERYLNFYYSVNSNLKKYRCGTNSPFTYCNEDGIFIKLEPYYKDIQSSNSQIRITITHTLVSRYGEEYSSSGTSSTATLAGVMASIVIVIIIVIIVIIFAIRKSRARQAGEFPHRMNRTNYAGVPAQTAPQLPYEHQQPYSSGDRRQPTAPPNQYSYPGGSMGQSSQQYSAFQQQDMNTNYHRGHSPYPSNADNSQNLQAFNIGSQNPASAPPPSYGEVMSKEKNYGVM